MLKNDLKITLRQIIRYKTYSVINITGLTIGFACFILLMLFIQYEFSYDDQHQNADHIYRAIFKMTEKSFVSSHKTTHSHPLLAPTLFKQFPEIITATRFSKYNSGVVKVNNKILSVDKWVWADNKIFNVFTLPFMYGDTRTALKDPFSVVLDEETAIRIFGHINPVGKTLQLSSSTYGKVKEAFLVTGVMENLPKNSHFRPHVLVEFETQRSLGFSRALDAWDAHWFHSYLLLKEDCNPLELEKKIQSFIKQKIIPLSSSSNWTYTLQPLAAIHLKSTDIIWNLEETGDIKYIYICVFIAIFILFIAGVNYVNLSTARTSTRSLEVSIRKVVGAHRFQLVRQFLGESLVFTSISIVSAVGLVLASLNSFSQLVNRDIGVSLMGKGEFVFLLLVTNLLISLFSGCYPALYLSGFKPLICLKGGLLKISKGFNLRNLLVVFQFTLSLFLIISTLLISKQLNYIFSKDLGFDREHVVVIDLNSREILQSREVIKRELLGNPGIKGASFSQTLPTHINWGGEFEFESREDRDNLNLNYSRVDYDFLDVFSMKIISGRNFSRKMARDNTGGACLLNETAATQFGWKDPLGKKIWFPGDKNKIKVVGIVKDFNSRSLHLPTKPVVLILNQPAQNIFFLSIKVTSNNIIGTISAIENIWKKYSGGTTFQYYFLDQAYNDMYKSEIKLSLFTRGFTLVAIFISCLGLLGLSTFIVERRFKEIGIRKVLGASVSGLFMLLSREFTKWMVLSNVFAWPIAYFFIKNWLTNFAYRISINVGVFFLSSLAVLVITLLTTSYMVLKSARRHPVDSLRYE